MKCKYVGLGVSGNIANSIEIGKLNYKAPNPIHSPIAKRPRSKLEQFILSFKTDSNFHIIIEDKIFCFSWFIGGRSTVNNQLNSEQ